MDFSIRLVFVEFTIDITSVADCDYPNGQFIVLYGIDDAIVTLTDSESFLS